VELVLPPAVEELAGNWGVFGPLLVELVGFVEVVELAPVAAGGLLAVVHLTALASIQRSAHHRSKYH
jgi:hypothetical protein